MRSALHLMMLVTCLGCAAPRERAARSPLLQVRRWAIQLQGLERTGAVEQIVASDLDLVVIEPTNTVCGLEFFETARAVARIQASRGTTGARKLCFAYLNLGQAESYRYYWREDWRVPSADAAGEPSFLLGDDPDGWRGNHPVAFWNRQWRSILFGRPGALLDQILADGFDGVYLDWVLAYEHEPVRRAARAAGLDPAAAVVDLIAELREHARQQQPGFLVIAQNGVSLADRVPRFLAVIDAFAHEDVSFRGEAAAAWGDPAAGDIPCHRAAAAGEDPLVARLQRIQRAGLPVLTLDYALLPENVRHAQARSLALGFVPFVSQTPLDRLPPPLPEKHDS